MSERLRTLQRILALQKTIADLADWRLAAGERTKVKATGAIAELDAFIAGDHPSGAFASLAGRTMGRLAAKEAEAERQRLVLATAKRRAETRLKLAEGFVDDLRSEERDRDERRRLEELTDAMLAAATQKTPQDP